MKKCLHFLLLVWVCGWAFVATLVVFIPLIAAAYLGSTGNLAFSLSRYWARIMMMVSFSRIRTVGMSKIVKGQPYIIVSNHQSFYDILAIVIALGIQFRWVIKKGILKVPLFGYALYASRNIFIDRSNPRKAMASIHRGIKRLPPGVSVMIFPEGGRSMDGTILPFKRGAFVMAIAKKWPVLPLTINGSRNVHAKGSRAVYPGTIEVVIGDPIDVSAYGDADMESLAERTRDAVVSNHEPDFPCIRTADAMKRTGSCRKES